jgi:hypothetical protein
VGHDRLNDPDGWHPNLDDAPQAPFPGVVPCGDQHRRCRRRATTGESTIPALAIGVAPADVADLVTQPVVGPVGRAVVAPAGPMPVDGLLELGSTWAPAARPTRPDPGTRSRSRSPGGDASRGAPRSSAPAAVARQRPLRVGQIGRVALDRLRAGPAPALPPGGCRILRSRRHAATLITAATQVWEARRDHFNHVPRACNAL